MSLLKSPIKYNHKFCKVQGVHDAQKNSFWMQYGGREPSTSKNHLLEVNRNVIKCKYIGKAPSYMSLGPQLVKNMLGMGPEVEMLMQSLDPGRLGAFEKLDTFRIS